MNIIETRNVIVRTRGGKIKPAKLEETREVKIGESAFCRIEMPRGNGLHDFATVLRFV